MFIGHITFRTIFPCLKILTVFLIAGFNTLAFSQMTIAGRILSKNEEGTIPYATVGVKGKNAGTVADSKGRFRLFFPRFVKQTDTVVISSIGYYSLELPVKDAVKKEDFEMEEEPKELPHVSVYSFFNKRVFKPVSGAVNFFRGANLRPGDMFSAA